MPEPTNPIDTTAAGTEPAATTQPTGNHWEGMSEEDVGFIGQKGWKSPSDLLKSYRNLESMRGVPAEELVRIGKNMDEAALTEVYTRLGRPADLTGYHIEMPTNPEEKQLAESMLSVIHKQGLNDAQAQALYKSFNDIMASIVSAREQQAQAARTADEQGLRSEWGQAYDTNLDLARRGREMARTKMNFTDQDIEVLESAIGVGKTSRLFNLLGKSTAEAPSIGFSNGGTTGNTMTLTPAEAKARRAMLMSDSNWVGRYTKGDKATIDEMVNLNKIIASEGK